MPPRDDPFYVASDEIRESMRRVRTDVERWGKLPQDSDEQARLKSDIMQECTAIEQLVMDLSETVTMIETDRITWKVDTAEITKRREFVDSTRRTLDEFRRRLVPRATPAPREALLGSAKPNRTIATAGISKEGPGGPGLMQEMLERQTDEQLDELHAGVQRIHQIGIHIGDKVVAEARLLDELNDGADQARSRLKFVSGKLDQLVKTEGRGRVCTIAILCLIVFVLLLLIMWT
eukprot:tig00000571_g2196.t1